MSDTSKAEVTKSILVEKEALVSLGRFPENIWMISLADGLFAANNATLPDARFINGLACFLSGDEAHLYIEAHPEMSGDPKQWTFNECREIAKSRPVIDALLLFVKVKIIEVHFIR